MDLTHRLTEVITVQRQTSHTKYGDPVLGVQFTMSARIERGREEYGDLGGTAAKDNLRIITAAPLLVGDLVWFPEDNPASMDAAHRVQTAHPHRDLAGVVTHYTSTT